MLILAFLHLRVNTLGAQQRSKLVGRLQIGLGDIEIEQALGLARFLVGPDFTEHVEIAAQAGLGEHFYCGIDYVVFFAWKRLTKDAENLPCQLHIMARAVTDLLLHGRRQLVPVLALEQIVRHVLGVEVEMLGQVVEAHRQVIAE